MASKRFTDTEVRFEQGDIRNLSDSVSGAALVFSSQVFHHLQQVDRLQALRSIHESLRISGKLVISDTFLDVANPFYRLLIAYYEQIAQCPYAIVMPDNLIEEARSIGFKLNRVHHTIP